LDRGEDVAILKERAGVYEAAQRRLTERWSGQTKNWLPVKPESLNPQSKKLETLGVQQAAYFLPETCQLASHRYRGGIKKWTMPIRNWKPAPNRFVIMFEDRLTD